MSIIDQDDEIDENMYKTMINIADVNSPDIIHCNYMSINNDNSTKVMINQPYDKLFDRSFILEEIIPYMIGIKYNISKKLNCHWTMLFKKDLLKQNNVFYDEDSPVDSDTRFLLRALKYAKSIYFVKDSFYHWIKHSNSLTHSYYPFYRTMCDRIRLYQNLFPEYDFNTCDRIQYNIRGTIESFEYVLVHKRECNVRKELFKILTSKECKNWFYKLEPYDATSRKLKKYVTKEQYNMAIIYICTSFLRKRINNLLMRFK